jgi:hypothetical protein
VPPVHQTKRLAIAAALSAAFILCLVGTARADELFVRDGKLYRVNARGGEKQIRDSVNSVEDVAGVGSWAECAPASEQECQGLEGGMYFFGQDGKGVRFIRDEEADKDSVLFSPGGKHVVLDQGTYVDRTYRIYDFASGAFLRDFYGMGLAWLSPEQFVFTLIDASKGERSENADIAGWWSVATFDVNARKLDVLARATTTEDFELLEVDAEKKELVIGRIFVNDARDWQDESKRNKQERRMPVKAAKPRRP